MLPLYLHRDTIAAVDADIVHWFLKIQFSSKLQSDKAVPISVQLTVIQL